MTFKQYVTNVRAKRSQEYANYMWVYWFEGAWGPARNCALYVNEHGVEVVDSSSLKMAKAIIAREYEE